MNITIKKFSRQGCRPCQMLSTVLNDMDLEEQDVTLEEIDVEEDTKQASKYGLMAVPVLVFLRNGVEMGRLTGFVPQVEIEDQITNAKEAK